MNQDPNLRLFCDQCGMLINIATRGEIRCPLCKSVYDASLLDHFEKTVNLDEAQDNETNANEEESIRTIIDEKCPQCTHVGLYFTTAQLRSADEGQTIFYECPKCGYRYQQNA